MKIRYIHHSCFLIEMENSFLLFDYYKHRNTSDFNFKELLEEIFESSKDFYVFASHSHMDHFNYDILSWIEEKSNTYYILSSDIKLYNQTNNLYTVKEGDVLSINNIKLNIFGSTDEGVSFMVNVEGLILFHADDLNWWKWPGDTPEDEKTMEKAFKNIVNKILKYNEKIDIAFFPVDGRLEYNYLCGGEYFIQKLNPKTFVPMHFWDKYQVTSNFKNKMSKYSTEVIEIRHPNELLKINS